MALPLEGRGVVASWDGATQSLTVWASTQMPHVLRAEVARVLGIGETAVRVIATDVGGGFGLKAHVFPEELLVPALARRLGRPVEWIEDRREHLAASQHAKDQVVRAELAVAKDGTMLALRAHVTCDIGAYVEYPWPTFEANVTAMLDCGDRAELVQGALRTGLADLVFTGPAPVAARLADIAGQQGARLHRSRPRSLEIADPGAPLAACRAWLGRD